MTKAKSKETSTVLKPTPFVGRRPYGPNAPWNVPVTNIPVHPMSSYYVSELWKEMPEHKTPEFNWRNYTYPVYNAKEATGMYTVISLNKWGNLHGTKIPFNPAWRPAAGTDAQIIILDPDTATEWNLWQVSGISTLKKTLTIGNGNKCAGNYWNNNWDDPATQTTGSRGAGINYLAMLVRPWEIEQGRIEHALSMPIIGTSGSEFWPPATKLEHPGKKGTIPEGARFSLDVTYEEIDAHVNSILGASVSLKRMVRILLIALKEYGWFITDTAGGQTWQLESLASAQKEWEKLGVYPEVNHLIQGVSAPHPRFSAGGFLTKERIRLHVSSDGY